MKVPMYIQVLYLVVTLASFYGQGATKNMHTNINLDMLQILIQQANDNLMYEGDISSYDPREFDEDYRHYNHLDDSKISSKLNIEIAISPEDNIEIKEVYLSSLSYIIDKTLTPKLTSMTYKVSNRRFNQLKIYLHDTIEVILDGNEDFINVSLPPSGEVSLSHSVPHPFNDNIIDGKSVPEDLINHEQQIKDEAVYH
ncbi:hypothetical protein [Pseudoalteromonas sp. MMG005]|uniref:hypothetical protein n=1 Tax=Pseudoalteromonas sp. MMG005 TaxID=2822682 RepID=UPI001B39F27E|nr:hypothetical protein [Pseudoalteromonas sp. MMG005]MBQ4844656.1 hypothetical protein [Pseudoalteromonas sp. MMG005]